MPKLSVYQRQAVAGLLGTAGIAVAQALHDEGPHAPEYQDFLVAGALIGWDAADCDALLAVGWELHCATCPSHGQA